MSIDASPSAAHAAGGSGRAFDLLHPSVQHHVVNTLGWPSLRPHQEQAIEPILRGDHALVQAPTAGGKTEAALLPLLSQMLTEGWGQPGILYLCPIKALLNDLEVRIEALSRLFGRQVAVWHGDVGTSKRRHIAIEPPDILLATPESVEVILVSRLVDHARFFAGLRAVVVDEVHAFAGDDRGWHLLALLERLAHLTDHPFQRIALSATLANGSELLEWLVARQEEPRVVIEGAPPAVQDVDVKIDFVGSLSNAALVISQLHRGEKRLVFGDSRSQVETLAAELRQRGVSTYVSHSSLSRDERLRAEAAFAQGSDCVIVATSTLELGIDVGDLDRVIQIDAPFSVASFLQRLGRSGRRAGTKRNCLFLATDDDPLLRAAAICHLWREGYVEPVQPPSLPYHVLAQQVLAFTLQEQGAAHRQIENCWPQWLRTAGINEEHLQEMQSFMLAEGLLFEDGGVYSVGGKGEGMYGRKNFLEIFSVFLSPPLFTVLHGRREIGQVHEETFRRSDDSVTLISLGGRGWRVTHVAWNELRAYVEPSEMHGKSRWIGMGQPMHFELAQAVKRAVNAPAEGEIYSDRAKKQLSLLRNAFDWCAGNSTTLVQDREANIARWWTFAGDRYNACVAAQLRLQGLQAGHNSYTVKISLPPWQRLPDLIREVANGLAEGSEVAAAIELPQRIKFIDCVPPRLLGEMVGRRGEPHAGAVRLGTTPIEVKSVA